MAGSGSVQSYYIIYYRFFYSFLSMLRTCTCMFVGHPSVSDRRTRCLESVLAHWDGVGGEACMSSIRIGTGLV